MKNKKSRKRQLTEEEKRKILKRQRMLKIKKELERQNGENRVSSETITPVKMKSSKANGSTNRRTTKARSKKRRKKESFVKVFFKFVAYELIFGIITTPLMLFYGPFENARSIFVGTAMGSMHYQWLATTFLSDEKINEILGTDQGNQNEENDNSLITFSSNSSSNKVTCQILDDNDNFIGHVITISTPTRVHVGYTSKIDKEKKEGETTSQIAENNNAVAAVNGGAFTDEADFQQWTANGGTPVGVVISNGKIIYNDLDNTAKVGMVCLTSEGRLIAGHYTVPELEEMGVTEAVTYETQQLVVNGKMTETYSEGSAPRTLIGQKKDGSILLVVLDSRNEGSRVAATIKEAQEVMYKLDCVTAATLDGGKSATMYYKGDVVNNPSYAYGERSIPTAIIVK